MKAFRDFFNDPIKFRKIKGTMNPAYRSDKLLERVSREFPPFQFCIAAIMQKGGLPMFAGSILFLAYILEAAEIDDAMKAELECALRSFTDLEWCTEHAQRVAEEGASYYEKTDDVVAICLPLLNQSLIVAGRFVANQYDQHQSDYALAGIYTCAALYRNATTRT